jgi:hypothetical protein
MVAAERQPCRRGQVRLLVDPVVLVAVGTRLAGAVVHPHVHEVGTDILEYLYTRTAPSGIDCRV